MQRCPRMPIAFTITELHVDYLMNVLPIVGTGMLGVFLVTGVIIAGVSLLNALTSKEK